MTDTKKLSMSELIVMHNALADKLGIAHETAFKNLAAARDAVAALETKMEQATNTPAPEAPSTSEAPAAGGVIVHTTDDKSKYNSSGKRGPTQGVGEYAKSLIVQGLDNAAVLAQVMIKFPSAKTSKGCIAFYRTALSKTPAAPDPAALRAQAQALLDKATAAEVAAKTAADKAAADEAAANAAVAATGPTAADVVANAEPALV